MCDFYGVLMGTTSSEINEHACGCQTQLYYGNRLVLRYCKIALDLRQQWDEACKRAQHEDAPEPPSPNMMRVYHDLLAHLALEDGGE